MRQTTGAAARLIGAATGAILAITALWPSAAAAQSRWEVGSPQGGDRSRILYIYNGNDGEAPALRLDCLPGSAIRVSHIMQSRIMLGVVRGYDFLASAGGRTIKLRVTSRTDALTGWNLVTHETTRDSPFMDMLRSDAGTLRLTATAGDARALTIDLAGNRAKVDAALGLCRR
jgi:hypothetical protein